MSDIAKVREMSDKELVDALQQAKQELWSARFALSTRQLNDTSSIPRTRHEIARILTVQRERGLGRGTGNGAATTSAATTSAATKSAPTKSAATKRAAPKRAAASTGKGA